MSSVLSPLVITGMHRSGTSLLAGLASRSGIDMGPRLLPPGKGNRRGHFEDVDFMRFHDDCLDRREASPLRPPPEGVPQFSDSEVGRAQSLLAARVGNPRWGWKDPRTALFLAAWARLVPNAFHVLLYRHPIAVALSLIRRGLDLEVQLNPQLAIESWIVHNRLLLEFAQRRAEHCVLWSIEGVVDDLDAALGELARRSGHAIASQNSDEHYVPAELWRGLVAADIDWRTVTPEAMALYDRLEAASGRRSTDPSSVAARPTEASVPSARERELMEAIEHLLAAALAKDRGEPRAVSRERREDYSELKRNLEAVASERDQANEDAALATERLKAQARHFAMRLEAQSEQFRRLRSTRGWRALHRVWQIQRTLGGVRRRLRWRLSSRFTRVDPGSVVVGCVVDDLEIHLPQARRLVQSLRWFGGSLSSARCLVCVVGAIPARASAAFAGLDVELRSIAPFDRRNPPANKLQFFVEALTFAPRQGSLLLLDCDTAVVGDPLALLVPGAFQAKIADVPSVTHEVFAQLFRHYGLSLPRRRYRTTLGGLPTIAYCNSGVIFVSAELAREFLPIWRDWNVQILDSLELLGACAHHCNQASLSLALAAHPIPFAAAPVSLNFPLHMVPTPLPADLAAVDPVILHYHQAVDAAGLLLPTAYPLAQKRIEALNQRLAAIAPAPRSASALSAPDLPGVAMPRNSRRR